ncbi:MAG: hypothetical protein AAFX76_08195 [Planctomycetota bacterium]
MTRPARHRRAPALALAGSGLLVGCHAAPSAQTADPPDKPGAAGPTLTADYLAAAQNPDDPRWHRVPAHAMALDRAQTAAGLTPREPGDVRFAYDAQALYLRFDFTDHDLVCTGVADGDELFKKSDIAEWFIGPPPRKTPGGHVLAGGWYLELHASAAGLRTATLWLRPGLPQPIESPPFSVRVETRGTLNDHTDRDAGWTAVLTLPWSALRAIDPDLTPQTPLSMLAARYNYGHHTPRRPDGSAGPELSMFPAQPRTRFHLRPFHAPIRLAEPSTLPSANRRAP